VIEESWRRRVLAQVIRLRTLVSAAENRVSEHARGFRQAQPRSVRASRSPASRSSHRHRRRQPGNAHLAHVLRDDGVGIDEDDLDRIGERFFRAKTSVGTAGTGIGLNLSKKLIEMHGGYLQVESRKIMGSTFFVRIPVVDAAQSGQVTPLVA